MPGAHGGGTRRRSLPSRKKSYERGNAERVHASMSSSSSTGSMSSCSSFSDESPGTPMSRKASPFHRNNTSDDLTPPPTPSPPVPKQQKALQLGQVQQEGEQRGDEGSAGSSARDSIREMGLKYHPLDDNGGKLGFLGNLTAEQEALLSELRLAVQTEQVDISIITNHGDTHTEPIECEDLELCLLRFLRCNGWNTHTSLRHIKANVDWRKEKKVHELRNLRPGQVLEVEDDHGQVARKDGGGMEGGDGFVEELFGRFYPHYHLGYDYQGRPVLLQHYGKFDTVELKKVISLENLARYHLWEQERNARLLSRRTRETGYIQETYNVILDFKSMRLGMFNGDFLWLLKRLKSDDERYYCERGGRTFIVNTPPLFNMIWQGIKGFMENTQSKIVIVPGGARGWDQLLSAIPADQLPPEYGGTALPIAETPFLSTMYTYPRGRSESGGSGSRGTAGVVISEAGAVERGVGIVGGGGGGGGGSSGSGAINGSSSSNGVKERESLPPKSSPTAPAPSTAVRGSRGSRCVEGVSSAHSPCGAPAGVMTMGALCLVACVAALSVVLYAQSQALPLI